MPAFRTDIKRFSLLSIKNPKNQIFFPKVVDSEEEVMAVEEDEAEAVSEEAAQKVEVAAEEAVVVPAAEGEEEAVEAEVVVVEEE